MFQLTYHVYSIHTAPGFLDGRTSTLIAEDMKSFKLCTYVV